MEIRKSSFNCVLVEYGQALASYSAVILGSDQGILTYLYSMRHILL